MGTSTIHYASLTEELGGKNGVHKCVSGKVGAWLLWWVECKDATKMYWQHIYMVEFGSTPPKEIIMSPRKGKGPFQKENSLPSCMSYVSFRGGGGNPQPLCYSLTCVLHKLRSKMVGDVDQLPIVTKLYNLRDEGPIEWFPSQRKKCLKGIKTRSIIFIKQHDRVNPPAKKD